MRITPVPIPRAAPPAPQRDRRIRSGRCRSRRCRCGRAPAGRPPRRSRHCICRRRCRRRQRRGNRQGADATAMPPAVRARRHPGHPRLAATMRCHRIGPGSEPPAPAPIAVASVAPAPAPAATPAKTTGAQRLDHPGRRAARRNRRHASGLRWPRARPATLLATADPFTETVQKGSTTLYRARFSGFDQEKAEAACKLLKRNDVDCLAMKI